MKNAKIKHLKHVVYTVCTSNMWCIRYVPPPSVIFFNAMHVGLGIFMHKIQNIFQRKIPKNVRALKQVWIRRYIRRFSIVKKFNHHNWVNEYQKYKTTYVELDYTSFNAVAIAT